MMFPDFSACFRVLLIFLLNQLIRSEDVFCGGLSIYKQQWLAKAAATIASQTTTDLKECLNICCSIPNCNAVTFMGFISTNSRENPSTNCMMFSCRDKCVVVDRPSAAEGVISVIINRTTTNSVPTTTLSSILPMASNAVSDSREERPLPAPSGAIPLTFPRPPVSVHPPTATDTRISSPQPSPSNRDTDLNSFDTVIITSTEEIDVSSTVSSTRQFLSQYTPIWAVGVAIVIAVVCIGVNVVLVSAFCCYKRHKNRMRSENFTHVKAPTLHAFNPTT